MVIIMSTDEMMLEELRAIRKALVPPEEPPEEPKGFVAEFKDFLSKYQVMGIAVAFILGIYLGALVQALVTDLVMPIIQLAVPSLAGWEDFVVADVFRVGHFAGAVVTFILVAIVVFALVKITKRIGIE
jgi:large conductance mechanosensitive channel